MVCNRSYYFLKKKKKSKRILETEELWCVILLIGVSISNWNILDLEIAHLLIFTRNVAVNYQLRIIGLNFLYASLRFFI